MDLIKVSKKLSYILRHHPEKFGITHDIYGYMNTDSVLSALSIEKNSLDEIVDKDKDGRYEFKDDTIRAVSGHSFTVNLEIEQNPPKTLFHGTPDRNVDSILEKGLLSQGRNNVHLGKSIAVAKVVANRYSKDITIFEIDTDNASKNGVTFFKGNKKSILATNIPVNCLKIIKI